MRLDVLPAHEVDRISLDLLPTQVSGELEPEIASLLKDFGNVQLAELGVSAAFNVVDARVVGFLAELSAQRIVGINDTTRRALSQALADGVLAGEGIGPLADRVSAVFEQSRTRALMIARTEVNSAANFARLEAMEQSGVVKQKKWLATLDARTRRDHLRLNGQKRDLRKPFQIPGTNKFAQRPGAFNIAAEDVNCRCVIIPSVKEVSLDDDSELLVSSSDRSTVESFDRRALMWEKRIAGAIVRAFARQEREVLRDLKAADRPR